MESFTTRDMICQSGGVTLVTPAPRVDREIDPGASAPDSPARARGNLPGFFPCTPRLHGDFHGDTLRGFVTCGVCVVDSVVGTVQ